MKINLKIMLVHKYITILMDIFEMCRLVSTSDVNTTDKINAIFFPHNFSFVAFAMIPRKRNP